MQEKELKFEKKLLNYLAYKYAYGDNRIYDELMSEGILIYWNCLNIYDEKKGKFSSLLGNALQRYANDIRNSINFKWRKEVENINFEDYRNDDENYQDLLEAINKLDDEERYIIKQYWGIETSPKSYAEIGVVLNCSREKVRMKERLIREKLKELLK